jgi:hypothetical protein
MDTRSSIGEDSYGRSGCGLVKNEDLICESDNVQIIRGNLHVINPLVNLLKKAPGTPIGNNDTILVMIDNYAKILSFAKDINTIYIQTLYGLLNCGWKLILHITLDGDASRTINIIENIQALLTTGNLTIYYNLKQPNDFSRDTELFVIPQTGCLLCFSTHTKNLIDSAFLFHSKSSIELLTERFFQNLNSAKPLLKSYPSQESSEFQQTFAEYEETPGEKYVFKGGLSTVTIPLDLYEKYLRLDHIPDAEFSHRIFLHKRRLDSFEDHVKHYKFKDICFIESVIELVDKKKYSFDEEYLLRDSTPQNEDIVRHLGCLINLLEKYDNYYIAFVSKAMLPYMNDINWMIKGNNCVLIETLNKNGNQDYFNPKMNFSITEKSVVRAFHDYFDILWETVPDKNKNKKETVTWLKSMIRKCNG